MEYDVFISHASEDKIDVVRPLAARLGELGVKVWLDEFQIKLGDSISKSIERGLAQSKFGIVVISQHFIKKEWTQRELGLLISKEEKAGKVILPIWHNITEKEVEQFSPSLVDKFSASTEKGIEHIAQQVLSVVKEKTSYKSAAANSAIPKEETEKIPRPQYKPTPIAAPVKLKRKLVLEKIKGLYRIPIKAIANFWGNYAGHIGCVGIMLIPVLIIVLCVNADRIASYFLDTMRENPAEVSLQGCEFSATELSCNVFNGFTDKRISKIEVEVKLTTPVGDRILRPKLSPTDYYGVGAEPLNSSTFKTSWSYSVKDSSLNSQSIRVWTRNVAAVH